MNSMSLKRNSRFDIMVAAAGRRCLYGAANGPCDGTVVVGVRRVYCMCRLPRAASASTKRCGHGNGLTKALTGARLLPHDDVKQGGPRRLASSSSTALGVTTRVVFALGFRLVFLHASSPSFCRLTLLPSAQEQAFDSFRPFISTAARTAVEISGVEALDCWQLSCAAACSVLHAA